MSTLAFFALLAMPVMPVALGAQQDAPKAEDKQSWKLTVGSNLVIVPVVVTNKQGDHVSGLRAEDFELKEEGAVQKIVGLDEITAETTKVEKAAASAASSSFGNTVVQRPKKLVIIALDQINTPFENVNDSHRALIDFLSKSVDESSLVALVAFQHNGVRIIHDFTNDPSVLADAIQRTKVTLTSRDTHAFDAQGDNSLADVEAMQITAVLNGSNAPPGASVAEVNAAAKNAPSVMRAQMDASHAAQDAMITLEDFQQLAQYFWGVPGRKSLIWASTGFSFSTGASPTSNTRGTTVDLWQRTFRMLADANISVYPVDVAGLLPGVNANVLQSFNAATIKAGGPAGDISASRRQILDDPTGQDPISDRHNTMRQMADMTGGQTFYNSNDISGLLHQARLDAAQYYMLAYYTKNTGKSGWRKLSLKCQRGDTKIRYRSGFFFQDKVNEAEPARQADEMMALTSDLDFTGMPLTGSWGKIDAAGKERKVHFLLSIPAGVPAIDNEHQNHLNFDFRAVATDSTGKVAASVGQRLETNLPAEALAQIQAKGLDYANSLTLLPGLYRIHFVVRDNLRGTLASVATSLKVD
jgi:VWFA-related protein